jgi:hypothetical protein
VREGNVANAKKNNCTAKDGAVEPKNDGCEWH